MDEATNSLDEETEKKVIESINRIDQIKIKIIISHRQSTVNSCNKIYLLDKGNIKKLNNKILLNNESIFMIVSGSSDKGAINYLKALNNRNIFIIDDVKKFLKFIKAKTKVDYNWLCVQKVN